MAGTNNELTALTTITRTLERMLAPLDVPARVRVLEYLGGWIRSELDGDRPPVIATPAAPVVPVAPHAVPDAVG